MSQTEKPNEPEEVMQPTNSLLDHAIQTTNPQVQPFPTGLNIDYVVGENEEGGKSHLFPMSFGNQFGVNIYWITAQQAAVLHQKLGGLLSLYQRNMATTPLLTATTEQMKQVVASEARTAKQLRG